MGRSLRINVTGIFCRRGRGRCLGEGYGRSGDTRGQAEPCGTSAELLHASHSTFSRGHLVKAEGRESAAFSAMAILHQAQPGRLCHYPRQFGHASGVVPIRYIDVRILIDVTSVGRAEYRGRNVDWIEFVLCPLRFLWIVSQERNGDIVL